MNLHINVGEKMRKMELLDDVGFHFFVLLHMSKNKPHAYFNLDNAHKILKCIIRRIRLFFNALMTLDKNISTFNLSAGTEFCSKTRLI